MTTPLRRFRRNLEAQRQTLRELEDRLELTKVQADSLPKSVRIGIRNLKKEIQLQIRL
jgi:hypothetical protein